jgi:hypothetical protein
MNWTKSNVNRLKSLVSLLCHASPSNTLYLTLLRQTNFVNISNDGDMQDVFQDSYLFPIWELYYLINNQSNHVLKKDKYYGELKNIAAVLLTSLQTSMSMTLDYILLTFYLFSIDTYPCYLIWRRCLLIVAIGDNNFTTSDRWGDP